MRKTNKELIGITLLIGGFISFMIGRIYVFPQGFGLISNNGGIILWFTTSLLLIFFAVWFLIISKKPKGGKEMAKKCAICHKKVKHGDHCAAVNKYTFKESKDHWQELHDKYGIHIVPQGWPVFQKPNRKESKRKC